MDENQLEIQKRKRIQPDQLDQAKTYQNEKKLLELTRNLSERVKELNCLYGISSLSENEDTSIDDILKGIISFVSPAWQYPEITCARFKSRSKEFTTANFKETPWKQIQDITVSGKRYGTIEVYYMEERPDFDEGPFLKEERKLLNVIAERVGHTIERKTAESNVKFLYQRERELREKLQSEIRVRVDFTRKLIHELKTPLTSLIATSQLLSDQIESDKFGKLAKHIWESANNLNTRIEELHDIVRGETGILKLNFKQINIEKLLRSVVEENQALCNQMGIYVDLNIEEGLPEIYADPDRIRQVMLNLINNALKYAKDGKNLRIEAVRKPGVIQFEVKDYGPGIPGRKTEFNF